MYVKGRESHARKRKKKLYVESLAKTLVFPDDSVVKNLPSSAEDARDMGLIPGWGRPPGEGNGNQL